MRERLKILSGSGCSQGFLAVSQGELWENTQTPRGEPKGGWRRCWCRGEGHPFSMTRGSIRGVANKGSYSLRGSGKGIWTRTKVTLVCGEGGKEGLGIRIRDHEGLRKKAKKATGVRTLLQRPREITPTTIIRRKRGGACANATKGGKASQGKHIVRPSRES